MASTFDTDLREVVVGDRSDVDAGALSPAEDEQNTSARKSTKKGKKSKHRSKKKNAATADAGGDDDLFRVISNPDKMLPNPRQASHKAGKKKKKKRTPSVQSMSSFSDYSSNNHAASSLGMGSFGSQASFMENMQYADEDQLGSDIDGGSAAEHQPSTRKRREEIMQEKIEMLSRISKMSKRGFAATKKWGIRDDIDEIRFECYRMTRENNSKRAVKNMQHGLITMATILEFANNVINPFNLKLQGFSRNMMLTVSDYDDSLEAIHHKWSGRTSIGPELTVLFTFATSAVFHHAGNVGNSSGPATSRQPKQPAQKPGGAMGLGDMSSMLGLFSNLMPKAGGNAEGNMGAQELAPAPQEQKMRRPMKGPSLPMASMSLP